MVYFLKNDSNVSGLRDYTDCAIIQDVDSEVPTKFHMELSSNIAYIGQEMGCICMCPTSSDQCTNTATSLFFK